MGLPWKVQTSGAAFVTWTVWLILAIKGVISLTLLEQQTDVFYFQVFRFWHLILLKGLKHSKGHWFVCSKVPCSINILWGKWRDLIDITTVISEAVRSLRVSAFCFQVFSKLAHVREKKIWWKITLGMKKRSLVFRCLEVCASSKDEDFILGAELKVWSSLFPCYILNMENYIGQLQKHSFVTLTCMSLIC